MTRAAPSFPSACDSLPQRATTKIGLSGPSVAAMVGTRAIASRERHGRGGASGEGRPHDCRDLEARLCGRVVERRAHRPRHRAAAQDQRQRRDPPGYCGGRSSRRSSNSGFRGPSTSKTARCSTSLRCGPRASSSRSSKPCRSCNSCATCRRCAFAGSSRRRRRSCRPQPVRQRFEQGGDPASLRHLQRFLPALPRRAHGLQLRLLHRFRQQHRPGAGRQARAYLPQAPAEARRDGCSTSAAAGARC